MSFRFASAAYLVVACAALASCSRGTPQVAVPLEITGTTLCSLDGMPLADYPGPKAQILYEQGPPDFFCDTVEMFSVLLAPEQKRPVRAVYVQDMAKTGWRHPAGNWIDARAAFYVSGSDQRGSMGATFASFAVERDARDFAAKHGGKLLRFGEVTPEMAALDGGALHDDGAM